MFRRCGVTKALAEFDEIKMIRDSNRKMKEVVMSVLSMIFGIFYALFHFFAGLFGGTGWGGLEAWNWPADFALPTLVVDAETDSATAAAYDAGGGNGYESLWELEELMERQPPEAVEAAPGEWLSLELDTGSALVFPRKYDRTDTVRVERCHVQEDGALSSDFVDSDEIDAFLESGKLSLWIQAPAQAGTYLYSVNEKYNVGEVQHLFQVVVSPAAGWDGPSYTDLGIRSIGQAEAAGYPVAYHDKTANIGRLEAFVEAFESGMDVTETLFCEGTDGSLMIYQMAAKQGHIYLFTERDGELTRGVYQNAILWDDLAQQSFRLIGDQEEAVLYSISGAPDADISVIAGAQIVAKTPVDNGNMQYLVYGVPDNGSGYSQYINILVDQNTRLLPEGAVLDPGDTVSVEIDVENPPKTVNTYRAARIMLETGGVAS